jgi:ABC-type transport system involved in multi-copper enzyme maturation permease subunit
VRVVLLIAANYVREQRWAMILLLLWVVLGTTVAGLGRLEREDTLFFIRQQAIYGVAFSAFLASSAIHNDRRSRRILAVLSKGIERGQYLAGLIAGLLLIAAIYCLAVGLFGSVMFGALGIPREQLWYVLPLLMTACAVAATTAILFTTFLPPLVAISLTALVLGLSVGLAQLGITRNLLPVYALMNTINDYSFHVGEQPVWTPVFWGIAQTVLLWLLASWIFGRRDIAVAVE